MPLAKLRATLALFALTLCCTHLRAQSWQMPPDAERCPSRWGADDQRGSANWVKPETILRATRMIRTGEVFELGDILSGDPEEAYLNTGRVFNLYTKSTVPVPDARTSNEELVITELGQIGTQLDGFAHQMHGTSFYNCFQFADIMTRTGFVKLGVEHLGTLMTRGVLIDVAALKGVSQLPDSYVVTSDDLQQALARQQLALTPGDAILIYTGWGSMRGKNNGRYGAHSPGVGIAAGEWLVRQDPMLVASDSCCVEVRPSEAGMSLPVHSLLLIQHGILLLENLQLDALAASGAGEFALVVQPLKLKGATGSAVAPVAIR